MRRTNFKPGFWLGIAAAVIALGLPSAAQATTNVVPNPGFEQGGCGDVTPIVCGWKLVTQPDGDLYVMDLDTTNRHSGSASLFLYWATSFSYGWGGVTATTDAAFCATIGPGPHAASFWYLGIPPSDYPTEVMLGAGFYQTPDCSGSASNASISTSAVGDGWQQASGTLVAPAGTQSALFWVGVSTGCDYAAGCGIGANFDDVEVDDVVVPDTRPPETTITAGPTGTTGSTSATFEFIADEPASFECSLDSAPFAACGSPVVYSGLAEGAHAFQVRATDTAGNTDPTPAERTWTVDTTTPQTTITAGPSGTTSSTSATFEFIADEPARFECSLDDATFAACSSPVSYSGLGNGVHTFRVRATDTAGNTDSTPAERSWTVQANTPPVAHFTFSCLALTCSFDGSGSADDGTITSYSWNFGDGTSGNGVATTHSYAQAAGFTVTLTVTDDAGASDTEARTVTLIRLTARGYKVKGLEKVDLSWTGPAGTNFDIYRDGTKIATVQASPYTDNLNRRGSGTYTYRVCAPAASSCSNDASVSF